MDIFIAILRGINVSGHRLIKMDALRTLIESLGCNDVSTYIQSGNIVFKSKENDCQRLAACISEGIKKTFGFDVEVLVLSQNDLMTIINKNPFPEETRNNPGAIYISYLFNNPGEVDLAKIEESKQQDEQLRYLDNVLFLYCPGGYGNTKISNTFLEKKLKVTASTRNWKTSLKLQEMAHQLSE